MGILSFIGLVALATALTSMYELFIPAMQQIEIVNPDDVIIRNKTLSYIVLFFFGVLFFIPLLPIVLIPSLGERFRHSLISSTTGQKI